MSTTPKLRFKEFSGEWEEHTLKNLGDFFKGSGISKAELSEDGMPCILYGELYTKYGEVISNIVSKTNLTTKNLVSGNKNDVLIPSSGETAIDISTASCLQQDRVLLGGDLNVFRPYEVNGIFISYQLNNSKKKAIAKLAQGASVVHIYNEQLKKLQVNIPSKEEQQKIVRFFSIIDKKIQNQQEKVQALKYYKKGMMQKIFSQEIRFKGDNGEYYPKWEEKKLGSLGETYTGLSGKTKDNFGFGNGRYITYMNVFKNMRTDLDMIDLVDIGEKENQNNVLKGDILFTTSSETPDEVGMASACDKDIENLYLNSFCFGFRLNSFEKINYNFITYYLRSPKIRKKISILAQGSTRYNLSKTELMKMFIKIPCLQEQQKIATFLSFIDKKQEKEQEKLNSLNQWKKGLLQQMFI